MPGSSCSVLRTHPSPRTPWCHSGGVSPARKSSTWSLAMCRCPQVVVLSKCQCSPTQPLWRPTSCSCTRKWRTLKTWKPLSRDQLQRREPKPNRLQVYLPTESSSCCGKTESVLLYSNTSCHLWLYIMQPTWWHYIQHGHMALQLGCVHLWLPLWHYLIFTHEYSGVMCAKPDPTSAGVNSRVFVSKSFKPCLDLALVHWCLSIGNCAKAPGSSPALASACEDSGALGVGCTWGGWVVWGWMPKPPFMALGLGTTKHSHKGPDVSTPLQCYIDKK